MAGVKGKFITLGGMLMANKPEVLAKANAYLESQTGKNHLEIDPESFYGTQIWDEYIKIYKNSFPDPKEALIALGRRVYPTVKRTGELPEFASPLEAIKFEAVGFLANHEGADVVPRRFIKVEDGEVIVEAIAPGYDANLYIGVFLGILELCDIYDGEVERLEGEVFRITWPLE